MEMSSKKCILQINSGSSGWKSNRLLLQADFLKDTFISRIRLQIVHPMFDMEKDHCKFMVVT